MTANTEPEIKEKMLSKILDEHKKMRIILMSNRKVLRAAAKVQQRVGTEKTNRATQAAHELKKVDEILLLVDSHE